MSVGTRSRHSGIDAALRHMGRAQGFHYIDLREGHIVAAVNDGSNLYFFDSNDFGLCRYANANEFIAEVKLHLAAEGWTGGIGIWTYDVTDDDEPDIDMAGLFS